MILKCTDLGVSLSNGKGHAILSGINFELARHQFLSIVGPSGCGKTTLLRTLAGILRPSEGVVHFSESSAAGPGSVLLVFQENNLFPWMTVIENATFGLAMQGISQEKRQEQARELLHRFGLHGREKAYPKELSLGMKQRVAIIRAFLSNPAIMLMDEPFAALDFQTRLLLQGELLALWERMRSSVVFVTHDIDEALRLSDRVLVLSHQPGRVIGEHLVAFPRPRLLELTMQPAFLEQKQRIIHQLGLRD
jgi:NitT/TauT family transport system ATP-binding protein